VKIKKRTTKESGAGIGIIGKLSKAFEKAKKRSQFARIDNKYCSIEPIKIN